MSERVVDQLPAVLRKLLPEAAPVEVIGALRPGRSHDAWVVRSSLGRLTVKVANDASDRVPVARLAEHARLWNHGIAVPRLLAWGSLAGHLVSVAEYLPGLDAAEALEIRGVRGMAEAMRSVGAAIAQLHNVRSAASLTEDFRQQVRVRIARAVHVEQPGDDYVALTEPVCLDGDVAVEVGQTVRRVRAEREARAHFDLDDAAAQIAFASDLPVLAGTGQAVVIIGSLAARTHADAQQ